MRTWIVSSLLFWVACLAQAQPIPQLLLDLERIPAGLQLREVGRVAGSRIVFLAFGKPGALGVAQVLAADTDLKSPVWVGPAAHIVTSLSLGERVMFAACPSFRDLSDCQVWSTDGTVAGTVALVSGARLVDAGFVVGARYAWFVVGTSSGSREWWRTDGTIGGTRRVGPFVSAPSQFNARFAASDEVLYSVETSVSETMVSAILAPTGAKALIATLQSDQVTSVNRIVATSRALFFTANRVSQGGEVLFATYAASTNAGIVEIAPPIASSSNRFDEIEARSDYAVIIRNPNGPWQVLRSDSTASGTVALLARSANSTSSASVRRLTSGNVIVTVDGIDGGAYGIDAAGATRLVGGPISNRSEAPNGSIFCTGYASTSTAQSLWTTEGTSATTYKVADSCDRFGDLGLQTFNTILGSSVVTIKTQTDTALRVSTAIKKLDLSTGNTKVLEDTPSAGGEYGAVAAEIGGLVVFDACNVAIGCALYRTDGTPAGTTAFYSFGSRERVRFAGSAKNFAFYLIEDQFRTRLLVTSGTAGGTIELGRVSAGSPPHQGGFVEFGGRVYFHACLNDGFANCGLWVTDGTVGSTSLAVRDIGSTMPGRIFVNAGRMFWVSGAIGGDMYSSDGTQAGTAKLVKADSLTPPSFAAVGGMTYFTICFGGTLQCSMYRTNGTASGTVLAADVWPYSDNRRIQLVTAVGNKLVARTGLDARFVALESAKEPVDLDPALTGVDLSQGLSTGSTYFFYAITQDGVTFWKTDGTQFGTTAVVRDPPDSGSQIVVQVRPFQVGTSVVFTRCKNLTGCELWHTDLLGATSAAFARIVANPVSDSALGYGVAGTRLVFIGDDGKVGRELWGVDVPPSPGDSDGDGVSDRIEATQGSNPFVKDNDIFSATDASRRLFVMQQARDLLRREATDAEVTAGLSALNGGQSKAAYIQQLLNTPEHFDLYGPIIRLYKAYFLRSPDQGGNDFWLTQYKNRPASGWSFEGISEFFSLSQEFKDRYGSLNTDQFVTLIYNNVLARAPEPTGFDFWRSELNSGRRIRGNVMAAFSESPENKLKTKGEVQVITLYATLLKKEVDPAVLATWAPKINAGESIQPLIDQLIAKPEYRARFLP